MLEKAKLQAENSCSCAVFIYGKVHVQLQTYGSRSGFPLLRNLHWAVQVQNGTRARTHTHTRTGVGEMKRKKERASERERGAGWRCVVRGSDFCRDRGGGGRGRRQGRKGRGKKKFRVFFYEVKHQIYKDPGGQNFRPFALLYEIKLKFVQQQQQSLVGRRGIQGKGRNRAGKLLVKVAHTFWGGAWCGLCVLCVSYSTYEKCEETDYVLNLWGHIVLLLCYATVQSSLLGYCKKYVNG